MPTDKDRNHHVHKVVCQWMRSVMRDKDWSANHWAALAGTPSTNITRVLNGEDMIIPNMLTIFKLAAVAGSQPDLLRGGRKEVEFVPVRAPRRRLSPARQLA